MLFAFKWLRSDTGVVNLICCASKGNLHCEFAFSLNQWILSNLNGDLNNDEFSQIKTRVHVLQQRAKKKKKGPFLYFKSCFIVYRKPS